MSLLCVKVEALPQVSAWQQQLLLANAAADTASLEPDTTKPDTRDEIEGFCKLWTEKLKNIYKKRDWRILSIMDKEIKIYL